MPLPKRIGLLTGTLSAILVILIALQSVTKEVETQTEGGGREFADGQIIVKLEEEATQADLASPNQRNDARTEESLPRSDVTV